MRAYSQRHVYDDKQLNAYSAGYAGIRTGRPAYDGPDRPSSKDSALDLSHFSMKGKMDYLYNQPKRLGTYVPPRVGKTRGLLDERNYRDSSMTPVKHLHQLEDRQHNSRPWQSGYENTDLMSDTSYRIDRFATPPSEQFTDTDPNSSAWEKELLYRNLNTNGRGGSASARSPDGIGGTSSAFRHQGEGQYVSGTRSPYVSASGKRYDMDVRNRRESCRYESDYINHALNENSYSGGANVYSGERYDGKDRNTSASRNGYGHRLASSSETRYNPEYGNLSSPSHRSLHPATPPTGSEQRYEGKVCASGQRLDNEWRTTSHSRQTFDPKIRNYSSSDARLHGELGHPHATEQLDRYAENDDSAPLVTLPRHRPSELQRSYSRDVLTFSDIESGRHCVGGARAEIPHPHTQRRGPDRLVITRDSGDTLSAEEGGVAEAGHSGSSAGRPSERPSLTRQKLDELISYTPGGGHVSGRVPALNARSGTAIPCGTRDRQAESRQGTSGAMERVLAPRVMTCSSDKRASTPAAASSRTDRRAATPGGPGKDASALRVPDSTRSHHRQATPSARHRSVDKREATPGARQNQLQGENVHEAALQTRAQSLFERNKIHRERDHGARTQQGLDKNDSARQEQEREHSLYSPPPLGAEGVPSSNHSAAEPKSAFLAQIQETVKRNAPVQYIKKVFDVGGDFDLATGVFVAPITGVYVFSYQIFPAFVGKYEVELHKNGTVVSRTRGENLKIGPSEASTVTQHAKAGDSYWLQISRGGHLHKGTYSCFSGTLVAMED